MILSSFIPDTTSSPAPSAAPSGKAQIDAQAQFDDVLAKVPDSRSQSPGGGPGADNPVKPETAKPSANIPPFNATSFFVAVSNTQTATVQTPSVQTLAAAPVSTLSVSGTASLPTALNRVPGTLTDFPDASRLQANEKQAASDRSGNSTPLQSALVAVSNRTSIPLKPSNPSLDASGLSAPIVAPAMTEAANSTIQLQPSLPGAISGPAELLDALSTKPVARSYAGSTDAGTQTAAVGRRRPDSKTNVEAGDTQGSAIAPTPSLLSGLGLLPATVVQAQAGSASSVASTGFAKRPSDIVPASALKDTGGTALPTAASGPIPSAPPFSSEADTGGSGEPALGSPGKEAAMAPKEAVPTPALAPIVKSVVVEAQLAPSPTLSPMQQVIDTVQRLATGQSEPISTAAAPVVTTPAAPALPSRTMTLVLEPDNLGTVTVRMQLRGNSLDLQLDVANSQTLGVLTRDKDSLTAAMSGQDYQIGTLTMRASDTQTGSQGNDNGTQTQDQRSGGSSSFQGGSTSQDGRSPHNDTGASSSGAGGERPNRQNAARQGDDQPPQRESRALSSNGSAGVYI